MESSFVLRRDLLHMATRDYFLAKAKGGFSLFEYKEKRRKKLSKARPGDEQAVTYYESALGEMCGPEGLAVHCIARAEANADAAICQRNGWKTIDQMQAEDIAAWKAESEARK